MTITIGLDIILLYIEISILIAILCYEIGNSNSIKDDIKSLDYDNLMRKYNQLKDTIKIIKKDKKERIENDK